ncbi:uncharacterized protein [Macaca nemestrina]|uniref:uncharacterized protein isoform X1 n=1 Tax=Macaca nemestrina TaxID=9545 RepID=UPI0039B99981
MPIGTQSWAVHWTRWQMSFLCCCFPSPPVWAEATAFGDVLQTEAAAEAWLPEELLSSLRKKQSPTYHDHPPAWRKLHASSSDKHGNQSPANAAAHHPCSAAQQPLPHPISRASCRRAPTCLWTHTPLLLFAQGIITVFVSFGATAPCVSAACMKSIIPAILTNHPHDREETRASGCHMDAEQHPGQKSLEKQLRPSQPWARGKCQKTPGWEEVYPKAQDLPGDSWKRKRGQRLRM